LLAFESPYAPASMSSRMPFLTRRSFLYLLAAARPTARPLPFSFMKPELRPAIPASNGESPADSIAPLKIHGHGDLNNAHAARDADNIDVDPAYDGRSLAIRASDDDKSARDRYRPFLISESLTDETAADWVAQLELSTTLKMVETEILARGLDRLRILVLYGSLRSR